MIAGAGAVGRSIARELIENGHDIMLLERNPEHVDIDAIPAARWHLGDACELSLLESVHLEEYDVVVAATGDDKANVVVSLLAKSEFAVPRVVARVNDPRNECCSTRPGASTSRCPRHGCWRHWSRRRCRSATWCG